MIRFPNTAQYFPFDRSSTMRLNGDVLFPYDSVYGAVLYPRVSAVPDGGLEVTNMKTAFLSPVDIEHTWTISSIDGGLTLSVVFSSRNKINSTTNQVILKAGLIQNKPATGYVMQGSYCCGCIRCTAQFYSTVLTMPVEIELEPGSLILDSTVLRYRQNAGFREMLTSTGEVVRSISFDPDDFVTNPDGSVSVKTTPANTTATRTPIRRIYLDDVNYIEAADTVVNGAMRKVRDISITAQGDSGLKVVTTDVINIGRGVEFL